MLCLGSMPICSSLLTVHVSIFIFLSYIARFSVLNM
nr:MAG TPA: hypothetical protein [Caudoviricetes sp.]